MASMKCGACRETHTSVAEVRSCYNNRPQRTDAHDTHVPDARRRHDAYDRTQTLRDMRNGTVHRPDVAQGPGSGLALVKEQRRRLIAALAELAPGKEHVYVAALVDDSKLRFFKLDMPTSGKWAGTVFIKEQASDDLYPVRNVGRQASILDALLADPGAALARYGKELGQCGICGKTLTDENSRARGIGPVCADKMGAMI